MTVRDIENYINIEYPFKTALDFDNSGANIVSFDDVVNGIVVCLDITVDTIEFAKKNNANLIISHHPIIFDEIRNLNDGPLAKRIKLLNKYSISAISCHTNFDSNLTSGMGISVLKKLFDTNDISSHNILDKFVYNDTVYGIGDIVTLHNNISFDSLLQKVITNLDLNKDKISFYNINDDIKKIIIIPGSGSGDIDLVINEKPDVLITSDIKHNQICDLLDSNISYINATHYGLEKVFIDVMSEYLKINFKSLVYKYYNNLL